MSILIGHRHLLLSINLSRPLFVLLIRIGWHWYLGIHQPAYIEFFVASGPVLRGNYALIMLGSKLSHQNLARYRLSYAFDTWHKTQQTAGYRHR